MVQQSEQVKSPFPLPIQQADRGVPAAIFTINQVVFTVIPGDRKFNVYTYLLSTSNHPHFD